MLVWALLGAYISAVVLLNIPTVQQFAGSKVSEALSKKLGTTVTVGRVDIGLLNRIIIDDVAIRDQRHRDMFLCRRLSAKLSIIDILQGRISISSAQIFSVTANIIKPSAVEPLNCQFVIDSLQSKDTTSHTPLDLHIGSLVIRNSNVSYNRLDMSVVHNAFDVNHLKLSNLSAHLLLNKLTNDSLSVIIKKLSVKEENSTLDIHKLAFNAIADKRHINISDFILETANSTIGVNASVNIAGGKVTRYKAVITDSKISPEDVALFVPKLYGMDKTVYVNTTFHGTDTSVSIPYIHLSTTDHTLAIKAKGEVSSFHNMTWKADITTLHADSRLVNDILTAFNKQGSHDLIAKVGFADARIAASGSGGNYKVTADIRTAVGNVNATASYINKHLTAKVSTSKVRLGVLLGNNAFSDLDATLHIQTDIVGGMDLLANTKADISLPAISLPSSGAARCDLHNLRIRISQQGSAAEAALTVADLNINADVRLSIPNLTAIIAYLRHHPSATPHEPTPITLTADIAHVNPHALGLISKWPSRSFSTSLNIDVRDIRHPLDNIIANIHNLHMSDPAGNWYLDHLTASSTPSANGIRTITLDSDFANATIEGAFNINNIHKAFTNLVASRLPTLPGLYTQTSNPNPNSAAFCTSAKTLTLHSSLLTPNSLTINAAISDTEVLRKVFGINVSIAEPITVRGYIDSRSYLSDIAINAPDMTIGKTVLTGTTVHVFSPDDVLHVTASTSREDDDNTPLQLSIEGQAANNLLTTSIHWADGSSLSGTLNAQGRFMANAIGKTQTMVSIQPSEIVIGDTTWHVRPATITYYANHLDIDSFSIENGTQHIRIDGTATPSATDSLIVSLRDVNVGYIMDLVNFHSVEFDGLASGTAVATSIFSKPDAHANLYVHGFTFEKGRMGTLHAMARWDNEQGQIDIDALCDDTPGKTKIDGYVSIKRNYIDLDIKAQRTRLEFIQSFCSSFLDKVEAEGSGNARVFGDLSTVNLTGILVANGTMHVSSLGTTYTMHNDTVTCIPDEILFRQDSILDSRGGYGLVSGALHHKHLTRMTFDFDIDAHHLLCYNFPNLDGNTFGGYCIGTGNCKIKGLPGEITFDIDAYPENTSQLTYNVSSAETVQNQEFITWRNSPTTLTNPSMLVVPSNGVEKHDDGVSNQTPASLLTPPLEGQGEVDDYRTDIRLNFLVHCTPASTLRLIMDQRTGDIIKLNGSGTLRATWYNKGGMQIFGNYAISHGTYKMTIQQVITKNFEFQPGGSIIFSGDPMEAAIRMQALYVIPSVSLSDLNLGSSLSNITVRVNCLMNITGTAEHPTVDFDLTLPHASTDIQQMITSLMDSEEQRTQQVIYLLSIGRFYTANSAATNAETNRTSLAMQSFLSGTLSQQINNIISSQLLKTGSWNFGANISPGDEGMSNAEYEGLINGRLLNNRLLINGQFGYRDNVKTASSSFIGDFDVRYLITPSGTVQVKVYNQATDRYFIKNNLNTQGIGIILKHDFDNILPKFMRRKKK